MSAAEQIGPPEIMTLEEVAAYLRTSEKTVQRMIQSGELKAGRRGRRGPLRFYRPDVIAWVRGDMGSGRRKR